MNELKVKLKKMPWKHKCILIAFTIFNIVLSYYAFDSWILMIKGFLFGTILLIASYFDIRTRIIPDWIHVLIILVGFIDFDPVKSILGLVITPIPFLIMAMFQEGSIGGGDVKLVGACGFAWGALDCIFISIIGNLFAIIVAILYQCKYKKMKQTSYPYVPLWLIGWLLLIVT